LSTSAEVVDLRIAATERGVASGVTAGKINRITGLASIDFKTNDGVQSFDGACKRAEKLF
jgi:hypothetical protein